MGKVDGLIIPRSYNDYFSRTDLTELRQAMKSITDSVLSESSENAIQNKPVATAINAINAKIPNQATSENQLADKEFVNSSVATNTANYISDNGEPFASVAALEAYAGTVTNNDYAFVTGTDAAGNTYYDRYKATVSGSTVTWAKEYRLNNSSFTAEQWAAIQSGITAAKVSQYDAMGGVILASSATITGPILSNNIVLKIMFSADIAGVDGATALQLTYNGTPYTVKAARNGALVDVLAKQVAAGTFKYLQSNTTLELVFDGSYFVVVGNPVVLSSTDYEVYANGLYKWFSYSTTERWTGHFWTDGKPIYNRSYYSATNWTNNQVIDTITEAETIVKLNKTGRGSSEYYPPRPDVQTIGFNPSTKKLFSVNSSAGTNTVPATAIIEYTKTTDSAGDIPIFSI